MSRGRMFGLGTGGEQGFRWRAGEVTRLEGFSDAVFAFAVTLLVVSLEVPKSFEELLQVIRGFGAFAVTFALLYAVWHEHCLYFRRYGFQDGWTSFLNAVLLFFVLFYVYPLKFVFSAFFSGTKLAPGDVRLMFAIFGFGSAAVSLIFVLLYAYALRHLEALQLNAQEIRLTNHTMSNNTTQMSFGLLSALLAWLLPDNLLGLCGWSYFGIPVAIAVRKRILRRS